MESNSLFSQKSDHKKFWKLSWIIYAAITTLIILIFLISSCIQYFTTYKKAQELAVSSTLLITDHFDHIDKNDHAELVKDMYNFYTGRFADEADRDLGNLLTDSLDLEGKWDTMNGSYYLRYPNYFSFAFSWWEFGEYHLWIYISFAVGLLLLCVHLWFKKDQKKCVMLHDNTITCYNGNNVVKEFMISDINSVISAPLSAIRFLGNGIKYKINFVENRSDITTYVMEKIKEGRTSAPASSNSAEDLKQYKDLLDTGVITQEEFETKKKQLLGL